MSSPMTLHQYLTASLWNKHKDDTPPISFAVAFEEAGCRCIEYEQLAREHGWPSSLLTAPPAAETNDEGEYPLYLRAATPATPPTCAVSEGLLAVIEAAVDFQKPTPGRYGRLQDAVDALPPDWRSQITIQDQ